MKKKILAFLLFLFPLFSLGYAKADTIKIVSDTAYAMVTDILISEKTGKNVQSSTRNSVKQGNSGTMTSKTSSSSNMEKYSTKVLSTANQVNLNFDSAIPILEDELGKVISGIF